MKHMELKITIRIPLVHHNSKILLFASGGTPYNR